MVSLVIFAATLVAQLLITAAVLALAARAAGSARASFSTGVWVALVLYLLGLALAAAAAAIPTENDGVAIGVAIALILVQVLLTLLIFRRVFRLSTARALAPVGAYVGMAVVSWLSAYAVLKPFVLEAFIIPTQSMAPTLKPGDRFVVNKLLAPRRWDLVAYKTNDPEPVISCKRLVGLPGERLRFDNGTLFVDGQPLTAPEVVAGRYTAGFPDAPDLTRYSDGQSIQLGEYEFFFVGDNVERSKDSRSDGPTDGAKMVGVADVLYWPPARISLLR